MPRSLIGRRIGKLLVDRLDGPEHCICRCDCGNEIRVWKANLYRNNTRSCGCIKKVSGGLSVKFNAEHGIWYKLIRRCTDPKDQAFADYGGRGINVCDDWLESFETFISDMGPRPSPRHTLDRINNDLGYWASNCRWVTRLAQANNTRRNVRHNWNGESHTLSEWSRITGVPSSTLHNRIGKLGWTVERALSTPRLGSNTTPQTPPSGGLVVKNCTPSASKHAPSNKSPMMNREEIKEVVRDALAEHEAEKEATERDRAEWRAERRGYMLGYGLFVAIALFYGVDDMAAYGAQMLADWFGGAPADTALHIKVLIYIILSFGGLYTLLYIFFPYKFRLD